MRLLLIGLILFATACDSPTAVNDQWAVPEEITFDASLGIDLSAMNLTASGLYWQDIVVGSDMYPAVVVEDEVRFHYTIWLPDGRSVEATRPGNPFQSPVLVLIEGVAEGLTGMRPGGIRKLVIRPELGWYNGHRSIPALTTIVFEIELLAIL